MAPVTAQVPNSKFNKKINPKDFTTQNSTNRMNFIDRNKAKTAAVSKTQAATKDSPPTISK